MLSRLRARLPFVDHLFRTWARYQADTGDRLAAMVTYYWFLSLFPILLLSVYVLRLVTGDDAQAQVTDALDGYLPADLVTTIGKTVQSNAGTAGVIGAVGLLFSGLGWIDGLRQAIRTVWHQATTPRNLVVRKLIDIVALVGLVAVVGASVTITGLVSSGPEYVLEQLGVQSDGAAAKAVLKASGLLLTFGADLALFLYLFVRLARVPTPLRQVVKGAVFGAVGFGVLKVVGGFYVARTTSKGEATYGAFAVVVGLLLFLNLVSRLILLAAAFTVTGPGDDDVRPSGTADPEQARRAGVPEEYADTDLNVTEGGAPTPLGPALQGRIADVQQPERSWSPKPEPSPEVPEQPAEAAVPPHADKVVLAARVTSGVIGAALALISLVSLRSAWKALRSR